MSHKIFLVVAAIAIVGCSAGTNETFRGYKYSTVWNACVKVARERGTINAVQLGHEQRGIASIDAEHRSIRFIDEPSFLGTRHNTIHVSDTGSHSRDVTVTVKSIWRSTVWFDSRDTDAEASLLSNVRSLIESGTCGKHDREEKGTLDFLTAGYAGQAQKKAQKKGHH